jgi:hypothetical protein
MLVQYTAGNGAVVMTNGEDGRAPVQEILAAVAAVHAWPPGNYT